MSRLLFWSSLSLMMATGLGCDGSAPPPASSTPPPQASAPAGPDLTAGIAQAASQAATAQTDASPPPPTEEPEMISEVATVGSGKKGHGYGGGMYTEPARAFFRTKERIAFEIQIPDAMKTYKALDRDGKGPKTHEEFMEKIIQESSIVLPNLPEGHRYRYDPETEDLLVERPGP
ncbi:MAG TPA: hypothetical protein VIY86_09920 [Pirellulaceae bacterium]